MLAAGVGGVQIQQFKEYTFAAARSFLLGDVSWF
jgi:hypothetical protein